MIFLKCLSQGKLAALLLMSILGCGYFARFSIRYEVTFTLFGEEHTRGESLTLLPQISSSTSSAVKRSARQLWPNTRSNPRLKASKFFSILLLSSQSVYRSTYSCRDSSKMPQCMKLLHILLYISLVPGPPVFTFRLCSQ